MADGPNGLRVLKQPALLSMISNGKYSGSCKTTRLFTNEMCQVPKWMWKNEVMPPFIEYLRTYNEMVMKMTGDSSRKVSFLGMDLYSLHRSADEVLHYLDRVDPRGAKAARKRLVYASPSSYTYQTSLRAGTTASNDLEKTPRAMPTKRSLV